MFYVYGNVIAYVGKFFFKINFFETSGTDYIVTIHHIPEGRNPEPRRFKNVDTRHNPVVFLFVSELKFHPR
jgi:hypothetical protein